MMSFSLSWHNPCRRDVRAGCMIDNESQPPPWPTVLCSVTTHKRVSNRWKDKHLPRETGVKERTCLEGSD